MDGYEVAHRIRLVDVQRATRIIALTGYGQDKDRQQSAAAGFDGHVIKPITMDVLQKLL
jgi:CheY-like chemotaxis protein